jgi:hypothetical protein
MKRWRSGEFHGRRSMAGRESNGTAHDGSNSIVDPVRIDKKRSIHQNIRHSSVPPRQQLTERVRSRTKT